jgi:hypothetical protein
MGAQPTDLGALEGLRMRLGKWLIALACVLPIAQAQAQDPAPRTLAVPASASWQHAATSIILPPTADGLARGDIVDHGSTEQDVSAAYRDQQASVIATVYIYKTMMPDTAIWFDRALAAMFAQPHFGLSGTPPPMPQAFARPGAATASGLRATLPASGEFRSTAAAIAPLGTWLVKVRMSSKTLDAAALDARLTSFIQALRWPAETKAARVATPVAPCPTPLTFKRAKRVEASMGDTLMNAALAMVDVTAEGDDDVPAAVHCREGAFGGDYGMYRPDAARDRYVIALGDAGIALSVEPSLGGLLSGRDAKQFVVRLFERDTTSILPSFNRLPSPEQVMKVAGVSPRVSVTTGKP